MDVEFDCIVFGDLVLIDLFYIIVLFDLMMGVQVL